MLAKLVNEEIIPARLLKARLISPGPDGKPLYDDDQAKIEQKDRLRCGNRGNDLHGRNEVGPRSLSRKHRAQNDCPVGQTGGRPTGRGKGPSLYKTKTQNLSKRREFAMQHKSRCTTRESLQQ